ncbi:MAG: tetratricopeptide repeat protein [Planctomycetes bacterium]|nr:tetratricopeptide repeat protein [Planctomycetota bacterium]
MDGSLKALALCERLHRLWAFRGYQSTGRDVCAAALRHASAQPPTRERALALYTAGGLSTRLFDLDTAQGYHAEALAIRRELGDREGIGASLLGLGTVAICRRDYAEGIEFFEEALAVERELGDEFAEAVALGNLGWACKWVGDLEAALSYNEQGLAIRRRLGDQTGVANTLENLIGVARRRGDRAGARRYLRECLDVTRAMHLKHLVNAIISEAAKLAAAGDEQSLAARWLGACARLHAESGAALEPPAQDELDALLPAWRETVGGAAFDEAFAAGEALDAEEALDEIRAWFEPETVEPRGPSSPT